MHLRTIAHTLQSNIYSSKQYVITIVVIDLVIIELGHMVDFVFSCQEVCLTHSWSYYALVRWLAICVGCMISRDYYFGCMIGHTARKVVISLFEQVFLSRIC